MAVFFYNVFLLLFRAFIPVAALFHGKARQWRRGRRHIFERLEKVIPKNEKIIWVHCSSLGEFEQGRPVMEKLKFQYPDSRILLTFFSPSGYEVRKDYDGADWVFYLPMDGPGNARRFLNITNPSLVIFVKYEFWYYYLKKIRYRNIPLLLISALFRKDMTFFKWYGGLHRKMLSRFYHLFVQNPASKQLVDGLGLAGICSVSGDTRFDRVTEIAEKSGPVPAIEQFIGNSKPIVAGSTWPEDEKVLQKAFAFINNPSLKLIIAPHEISEGHLSEIKKLFPGSVLYSELAAQSSQATTQNILIIDNIGMLSRLYKYGYITYVGGGLTRMGVHNVLEAAVFNKIVFFGPHHEKHSEAVGLVMAGGGIPFNNFRKDGQMLAALIEALLADKKEYDYRSNAAGAFVRANRGATQKIIQFIQEKRLLTN